MFIRHIRIWLPVLALAALLAGLSGCGWQQATPSQAGASNLPDQVSITIHALDPKGGKPVLKLTDISLVRQLYTTVVALSPLPLDSACTDELGPSYTLAFQQNGKTLTTANAQRYGCRRVSLTGEKQDRRANQDFWSQLDQAIFQATPPASPTRLAILHTLQLDQPPQAAQISSVETVQQLYQAILALPRVPQSSNCVPELLHEYQLVFHTTDQEIPSVIDHKCNTISLNGNYKSRGGTFTMSSQFRQLFAQTLTTATFAPARPDHLTLTFEPARGSALQSTITDTELMQRLYTKIFALPTGKTQPNCPSQEDKVAGKGAWYVLNFTQWDLPILVNVDAYEGSCKFLSLDNGQGTGMGQILQADEEFWNLVHHAANS